MKESDIVYEKGVHWARRTKAGTYEVYKIGATCSVRCASIGFEGAEGYARAKAECDRREQERAANNA